MMDCPDGMLTREKVLQMLLYILPRLAEQRNIMTSFSYLEKMDTILECWELELTSDDGDSRLQSL